MLDDLLCGSLVELQRTLGIQTGILLLLRDEVALGNLNLLFRDISAHLDHLHTVEQRARNGIQIVGCGDKEHLAQIIVHIQVVIVECRVLLRIEHL